MLHHIKTWPPFFEDVRNGSKPFEFRKNDRGYNEADILHHHEYDPNLPDGHRFTGRGCLTEVTYFVAGGQFGIPPGYCIMGIKVIGSSQSKVDSTIAQHDASVNGGVHNDSEATSGMR